MSETIRDARLDRLISWALTAFCGLALAVGAYFFKSLDGNVKSLTDAVGGLKTEIAVMRKDAEDIVELKQKLERHEKLEGHPSLKTKVETLEDRIVKLENKLLSR